MSGKRFNDLAEDFRNVTSRKQFDNACQNAGFELWRMIEAKEIENPLNGFTPPDQPIGHPDRSLRFQLDWFILAMVIATKNAIVENVMAVDLQLIGDGVRAGTAGEWQSLARNFAPICRWLAEQCPNNKDWPENTAKAWAEKFGVDEKTIRNWWKAHEPFIDKGKRGRYKIDEESQLLQHLIKEIRNEKERRNQNRTKTEPKR